MNVAQVEWAQVRYETSRRRGKRGETLFSWVWVFFHFNLVVNPYDGPRRIKWKVFFLIIISFFLIISLRILGLILSATLSSFVQLL